MCGYQKILVCLALVLTSEASFAKPLSVDDVRKLQSKFKSSDTLYFEFTQKHYQSIRNKEVSRAGRAVFSKPNKFRWMIESPVKQYKIFDGVTFYDYDPSANSASRYKASGPVTNELRQIVDLVLNFDSLLQRYTMKSADEQGSTVKVMLEPKKAGGEIVSVELHYDTEKSLISFLRLNFRNKDHMVHEFAGAIKESAKISADLKSFSLPKDAKVSDIN